MAYQGAHYRGAIPGTVRWVSEAADPMLSFKERCYERHAMSLRPEDAADKRVTLPARRPPHTLLSDAESPLRTMALVVG